MENKLIHIVIPTDPKVYAEADKVAKDFGISRVAVLSWLSSYDHENRLTLFCEQYKAGQLAHIRKRTNPGKRHVKK